MFLLHIFSKNATLIIFPRRIPLVGTLHKGDTAKVKYSHFPLLIKAQRQFITATKLRNEAITKKTKHITA